MRKISSFNKAKNKFSFTYIFLAIVYAITSTIFTGYGTTNTISYMVILFITLLLIKNKFIHFLLIAVTAILAFIYFPIGMLYGPLGEDIVAAYYFTNHLETSEFLHSIPVYFYLIQALFLGLVYFLVSSKKNNYIDINPVYKFILASLLIFSPAMISYLKNQNKEIECIKIPSIRLVCEFSEHSSRIQKEKKVLDAANKSPSDWNPVLVDKPYTNIVIIIGESARREEMSAYGFKDIDTTPYMRSFNGVLFTDYITAAGNTIASLRQSLFYNKFDSEGGGTTYYNDSIVRLYKEAGYKTNWLSNQGMTGEYNSVITIAGKQADYSEFIKTQPGKAEALDEELLPIVPKLISDDAPTATFIHLMGSHLNACRRVGYQYTTFYRAENTSCYLQSLINTDKLINEVITQLKATNKDWKLIYFSDHGQRVFNKGTDDERYAHGNDVKVGHHSPLFITGSEYATKKTITNTRTGLDMVSLLASFGNISDPLLHKCEYFESVDCVKEPFVLVGGKLTKYESLKQGD